MSQTDLNSVYALMQGLQRNDPKLYQILKIITKNLDELVADNTTIRQTIEIISTPVTNPENFTYQLLYRAIALTWAPVSGALFYEIREGDVWETASYVTRVTDTTVLLPPRLAGSYTFLLKSFNTAIVESTLVTSLVVLISNIPSLSIIASVVDNNVLLDWTEPIHPFEIIRYTVYKNGNPVGYLTASFTVLFEVSSGTYEYGVTAEDIAGNVSPLAVVTAVVNQPPDFVLEDTITSDLSGTKSNCIVEDEHLVAIVNTTETWEDHFDNNSYDTIQDQIDDGFPFYSQPNLNTGYYEEIHDFGIIFASTIISINWLTVLISDTVLVQPSLAYSDDGISYTAYEDTNSLFGIDVRYVKFKLTFTGADDDDLAIIKNIVLNLLVKRAMDAGTVSVLAADAGGTTVNFNLAFKDIESITVTPLSTTEQVAIYDFVDIPNPTSFKILLFNTAGARINGDVSWKARGIL